MNSSQSKKVLASALVETYSGLFELDRDANYMEAKNVKDKLKTLTQGQHSDRVYELMAMTFIALCGYADFSLPLANQPETENEAEPDGADLGTGQEVNEDSESEDAGTTILGLKNKVSGFTYRIELILPESRDKQVYDVLFRSLKEHLLDG